MNERIFWLLISFSCLILAGCSAAVQNDSLEMPVQPKYETKEEMVHMPARSLPAYGSLWTRNQPSLFEANKAGCVGDILTVAIYERASARKKAETSADRSSSVDLGIPKLFGIETSIANRNPNLDPSQLLSASSESEFTGSGSTSREENLSATLTTRVIDVLHNGNMKIRGSKTVRVNDENQVIRLSGIVRPSDIAANNVIDSKFILNARIEYMGKGVISEKQRPGWLVRLIDTVWPF